LVRTDKQSLKFLLEQKVGTPFQHKYLTKLLGYGFQVEYKKGVENKVANALSHKEGWDEGLCLSLLSIPTPTWLSEVKTHYQEDVGMLELMSKWHNNTHIEKVGTKAYAFPFCQFQLLLGYLK
jgi:hypothetical protein